VRARRQRGLDHLRERVGALLGRELVQRLVVEPRLLQHVELVALGRVVDEVLHRRRGGLRGGLRR
jgi:hypothetical protein